MLNNTIAFRTVSRLPLKPLNWLYFNSAAVIYMSDDLCYLKQIFKLKQNIETGITISRYLNVYMGVNILELGRWA